ncbi:MAG TPA: T9SS type A sorting domain-containing protein [Ignavibacteriaceae bacterium]|nr:T9SS type A sorting domain-containing protein [Ignavibacteriaceae bacterium]
MNKFFQLSFLFIIVLLCGSSFPQQNSFEELIIAKETNPQMYIEAKRAAINQELPVSIKIPGGILIDVIKVENDEILYSVIKNILSPFSNGEILTYNQVMQKYDLTSAEINWGGVINNEQPENVATQLLLIPDWTNDNVLSFDPITGDLVNANYIPPNPGNLASPKHALLNVNGFISVSDQITDLVQKFDTAGNYIGIYAPAGGVNNTILDNLRGHAYRPNGNLLVTVGSGANSNAVPEFDLGGNFLGNFIAIGAGGLNSPFCILFRANDVLVTGSSSDAAHRYDLSGNYINNLISGPNFPQQIIELANGNLALAVFSTPSGLGIYDSNGNQLNFFTAVTGLRGVYQLPSGNFVVTNGAGLHEINGTNGNLIRTIYASANLQYISLVDYATIPVELTAFNADVTGNTVVLNWTTATEVNNQGFEIERASSSTTPVQEDWTTIGFVPGFGTTTEPKSYSHTDQSVTGGTYYYRLKQIDFDGSFTYSGVAEVEVSVPTVFSLEQNYPNPFNPSTSIQFSLPVDAQVKINIYNLVGERAAEVASGNFAAGTHKVNFSASTLTSGIYFYRLEATGIDGNTFSSIRKMTLLK